MEEQNSQLYDAMLGEKGWNRDELPHLEFEQLLNTNLYQHQIGWSGRLFQTQKEYPHGAIQQKFLDVLHNFKCKCDYCMVQFWVCKPMEGGYYLTTSDQPFAFCSNLLHKGLCFYREGCMKMNEYFVGNRSNEEDIGPIGPIGRVFRRSRLECSPDLRLYSAKEFPLRDLATRCHFKRYIVLPVFDLQRNLLGIVEYLSADDDGGVVSRKIETLSESITAAGLTTHTPHYMQQKGWSTQDINQEFEEVLELAKYTIPQLSLAQVWVTGNNPSSMTRVAGTWEKNQAYKFHEFVETCEEPTIDCNTSFCGSLFDIHIAKWHSLHYLRKVGLSFYIAICLRNLDKENELCVFEFFLQSDQRKESHTSFTTELLLQIIRSKFKSFELVEGITQHSSPKEYTLMSRMEDFKEKISTSTLLEHYKTVNFQVENICYPWLFVPMNRDRNVLVSNMMHLFIAKIGKYILRWFKEVSDVDFVDCLVQFWSWESTKAKSCLMTSDQPFALLNPSKGLFEYRRKCMDHIYFINDGATEKEHGPPGRVFSNKCMEFTTKLQCYTADEFPLRDCAVSCGLKEYLAIPILHKGQCIGALEFIGLEGTLFNRHLKIHDVVEEVLEDVNLESCLYTARLGYFSEQPTNVLQEKAEREISEMKNQVTRIPQVFEADVWVLDSQWNDVPLRATKEGIIGFTLESKNKSCFFSNICDFTIWEEPRALDFRGCRYKVCFSICLQSSYTGSRSFIFVFFLDPGNGKYEFLCSTLSFILNMMKKELKSFKTASGKQLGEELVVEVITFGKKEEFSSFESHQPNEMLPVRFEITEYGKDLEEHRQGDNNVVHDFSNALESNEIVENVSETPKQSQIGRNKKSFHLTREGVEPPLGMKLVDAEEKLGVTRSTLKRARKDLGIGRWPNEMLPVRFEIIEYGKDLEEHQQRENKSTVGFEKGVSITAKKGNIERNHRRTRPLTREEIEPHFGKKLDDARNALGGRSRSSFQRDCREAGIKRWPRHTNNKNNSSISHDAKAKKRQRGAEQRIEVPSSSLQLPSNSSSQQQEPIVNTKCTDEYVPVLAGMDNVIVKAKYEEEFTRFEFCFSTGMEKLVEEVGTRFELKRGSFEVTFIDGDGDEIKVVKDEDLRLCAKTMEELGKPSILLLIKQTHSSRNLGMDNQFQIQTHSSSSSSMVNQFPVQIRDYIERIIDVKSDGNCGYRVVALLLGRSEEECFNIRLDLMNEILLNGQIYRSLFATLERLYELLQSLAIKKGSMAPHDKWMSMPDMGYVIATTYNLVLVYLSDSGSMTFFPLKGSPPSNSTIRVVAFGYVNGNHFVQVILKENSPLPEVALQWPKYCECETWITPYLDRMVPFHHSHMKAQTGLEVVDA